MNASELDLVLPAEPKHEGFADIQTALHAGPDEFPFRCELSLEPLITFWTRSRAAEGPAKAALARIVAEEVRGAPELMGTITDHSLIERHPGLIDILMA